MMLISHRCGPREVTPYPLLAQASRGAASHQR
jgi:hypothetical protein